MNRFAALLDRLAYEPRRNAKLALIADYFRSTPDPERGWALAAMTGALTFRNAKAGLIRDLIAERTDPVLFALSYDYVGDLSETVALMWPTPEVSLPPRSGGEGGPSASGGPGGGNPAPYPDAPPPLTPPLRKRGEGKAPLAASGSAAAGETDSDTDSGRDSGTDSATPEAPLLPRSGGEGGPSASGGPGGGSSAPDLDAPPPLTPPLRKRGEGNAPHAASEAAAAGDTDSDTDGGEDNGTDGATPEAPLPPRSGGEGGPSASGGPGGGRLRDDLSPIGHNRPPPPALSDVVATLGTTSKTALPKVLAGWLDHLDETGRWALLKLITGSLRIGVSARLAKTAVAALGPRDADEIELVWPGLTPPYESLFAWVEGRGERPESVDPAPFRPPMLAHGIEEADFGKLDPADFAAEWKWDGIRVQAAAGTLPDGRRVARLYSRTGEDISAAFPDLVETLAFDGAIDGELLVLRESRVQSFNVLQQRLNRKQVTVPLLAEFPAHIRAYDLLFSGTEDLRERPFAKRRAILEEMVAEMQNPRIDISPLVPFETWEGLAAIRLDPASAHAGADADAIEGLMIKHRQSPYLPGRPKGPWWKWKRDPMVVDCVLMYAQRGHGKRSSFYSDFTFGVWRDSPAGDELVPVGKAYFGFTDEELGQLDRFVRNHTTNRFGPVREVTHTAREGLVLEIAFEGLQRSTRHKSGIAMRFPRISRIRWDKPPGEADRIEALEARLKG